MKVLIITGKLASPLVKRESNKSEHEIHVHVVNTPIAAFLTPKKIVEELQNPDKKHVIKRDLVDQVNKFDLNEYDSHTNSGPHKERCELCKGKDRH